MRYLVLISALIFEMARPGYRYDFPRDHFNHPGYQTEWWYYTGNLKTGQGRRFGFELTFFRRAVGRPDGKTATPEAVTSSRQNAASAWDIRDLYLAHLALSDIESGRFYSTERLNRTGPGLAGASVDQQRIWNGNWQVKWSGTQQNLQAIADDFSFTLDLNALKPPVIHGRNGISAKGPGPGQASHYISLTRLAATGEVVLRGERSRVSGTAWMDHEFFTHQLNSDQVGWDWLSAQLDDLTELMLFRLRRRDGTVDPFSAGTFIDRDGSAKPLALANFTLEPLTGPADIWPSPTTGARYPIHWRVRVPSLGIDLDCSTPLASQELVNRRQEGTNYWEGAVKYNGQSRGKHIEGLGYLEMTGYDRPFRME